MFYKKTIILVSANGGSEKGVLSLNFSRGVISGDLKLYNTTCEGGIMVMSFLNENKVVKCGLVPKGKNIYTFESEQKIDIDKAVCAVVNVSQGKAKPIIVGTCSKVKPTDIEVRLATCVKDMGDKKDLKANEASEMLDKNGIDYDEEEKSLIDDAITKEMEKECSQPCSSCKYREAFFTEEKIVTTPNLNKASYYSEVSEQIKDLFDTCEPEDYLEKIIPSSKWVKVDYEKDGNYYVVGLIYENDELKFVCYGVPGFYASDPPKELEGICKWVPNDTSKPFENGYWLTYQDAETGDNIDVEIV